MNNEAMKEVLNELFSHLEKLETQNEAILQFLKEKKRVTDKQLAPYLEQAGNASNVKWRAARVRIDHLLSSGHPEEEVKLGKRPELYEASPSAEKRSESDAKEEKRVESVDEESKRTEPSDQKRTASSNKDVKKTEPKNAEASLTDLNKKEKPAPAEAAQVRPTDAKADKPEATSESKPRNAEQRTEERREQKPDSDGLHHPTEVSESAEQQAPCPNAFEAGQYRHRERGGIGKTFRAYGTVDGKPKHNRPSKSKINFCDSSKQQFRTHDSTHRTVHRQVNLRRALRRSGFMWQWNPIA